MKRNQFTKHNKPFRLLNTVRIGLRIPEALPFGVFCFLDFVRGAVADEDGFASPFYDNLYLFGSAEARAKSQIRSSLDSPSNFSPTLSRYLQSKGMQGDKWNAYVFAFRDRRERNFNLGLGEHVGGSRHVNEEI